MEKQQIQRVFKIVWNTAWVYVIAVFLLLVVDINRHPENYALVYERPQKAMIDNGIEMPIDSGIIYPEWYYKASTVQECRPLVNILGYWDNWLKPSVYVLMVLAAFNILLQLDWDKLKKEEGKE